MLVLGLAACSSTGAADGGSNLGGTGGGAAGAVAGAGRGGSSGSTTGGTSNGGATTAGATSGGAGASGSSSSGAGASGAGASGAGAASGGSSAGASSGGGSGAAGTSSGGAAGAAGASSACTALFCESFESGALAPALWTSDTEGGSVSVVADPLAHGTHAVRLHLEPNGNHALIVMNAPAGVSRHVFGRAWFHVSSPNDKPASPAHTVYFSAGDGPSQKHYELGGYDAGWQTSYWFPGGESIAAGGSVPVNKSACVEWEFDDAPGGVIRVWVDGSQNYEFTSAGGGNQFSSFQKLSFGLTFFQKVNTAVDLTLDDLAIDTKKIGCAF